MYVAPRFNIIHRYSQLVDGSRCDRIKKICGNHQTINEPRYSGGRDINTAYNNTENIRKYLQQLSVHKRAYMCCTQTHTG